MTAAEILALAKARGVTIRANGDDLDVVADHEPDPELLAAIAGGKASIFVALRAERARINFWIAARITDTPRNFCLNCRKPIIPGQKVVPVASGEALAHFHEPCHGAWLVEQERLARKALGLGR